MDSSSNFHPAAVPKHCDLRIFCQLYPQMCPENHYRKSIKALNHTPISVAAAIYFNFFPFTNLLGLKSKHIMPHPPIGQRPSQARPCQLYPAFSLHPFPAFS